MRIRRLIENADHPKNALWGRLMIAKMNLFHSELSRWGFSHIRLPHKARSLDLGCGGGRNVSRLRRLTRGGLSYGVDVSALSVRQSVWCNLPAILAGKTAIFQGGADNLPFREGYLDVVTAFETVYYWPNLVTCFREIRRVLRPGGLFLICNEDTRHEDYPDEHKEIEDILAISFYSNDELENLLLEAGFSRVETYAHHNGHWIAVVAYA